MEVDVVRESNVKREWRCLRRIDGMLIVDILYINGWYLLFFLLCLFLRFVYFISLFVFVDVFLLNYVYLYDFF